MIPKITENEQLLWEVGMRGSSLLSADFMAQSRQSQKYPTLLMQPDRTFFSLSPALVSGVGMWEHKANQQRTEILRDVIWTMEEKKIEVLALLEVRWPWHGILQLNGTTTIYSGMPECQVQNRRKGVALVLSDTSYHQSSKPLDSLQEPKSSQNLMPTRGFGKFLYQRSQPCLQHSLLCSDGFALTGYRSGLHRPQSTFRNACRQSLQVSIESSVWWMTFLCVVALRSSMIGCSYGEQGGQFIPPSGLWPSGGIQLTTSVISCNASEAMG